MILVTGSSGFIGSYLLNELIKKYGKEEIIALSSIPTDKCAYLLHNNYNFDNNYFIKNGYNNITTIIHAGAFTPKNVAESNDILRSNSNIMSTYKLLQCVFPKLKKFLFLSTLDVYDFDNPLTELSPLNPISMYGQSKLYAERMITTWAEQKNIASYILRVGHVYGPGEEVYQKLMPTVIKQVIRGEPVKLFGTGEDVRTFIYITDVVDSIVKALNLNSIFEIINIVGDEMVSVKSLINQIIDLSGKDVSIETVASNHIPRNLIFDNTKLKTLLHTPQISLSEGLKIEIDYLSKL